MDVPHYLRSWVYNDEVYLALVSGTRPVYFQENQDAYIWGSGTLFLLGFAGYEFALTAKHVFSKVGADPRHTRILLPYSRVAIPLSGAWYPSFPGEENQEDLEDMCLLQIDQDHEPFKAEQVGYMLWKLEEFWVPAWLLEEGEQVFAVGFPSQDDRFDYDNLKLQETAMVAVGKLIKGSGKGLCTIDCAEFDREIAGASGGPVFARVDGYFVFIGMMIRGGAAARKIHFIDAQYVLYLVRNTVKALEQSSTKYAG